MYLKEEIGAVRMTASSLLKYVSHATPLIHRDEILTDLDSLEIEIKSIIEHKNSLQDFVPRLALRNWAVASFRMALKKIRIARTYAGRKDDLFIQQVRFAALWGYQACDIVRVTSFLRKIIGNLEEYTLYSSHLEKGDVVLSYKTDAFLRHDLLARIVAIAGNTHITHALMVSSEKRPHDLVSANPRSAGIGLDSIEPKKGEMYIVMRYRPSVDGISKEKILESMDTLYNPKAGYEKEISFAELKSWAAALVGFIYTYSVMLFGRAICLSNPIKKDSTLFCSEFVDEVFGRVNAYLSPRSEYHSVIAPAELFFSPFLEFKGVIFNPEDRASLITQISKTFTLLIEDVEKKDTPSTPSEGWMFPEV